MVEEGRECFGGGRGGDEVDGARHRPEVCLREMVSLFFFPFLFSVSFPFLERANVKERQETSAGSFLCRSVILSSFYCSQETDEKKKSTTTKNRLLTFEQAHFDASRHADEIARVQAATTAMRALGRLPPTRRRPSSAGGAAPLGGVALGDFGVAAAGPAAGTAAAAPPAASEAFRSPSAPAAAAPPPGFEDAFARRLQQQEAAAANAANAAAAAAAAAAAVFSTARPVSAAAVPPSRPPPPPPPSSSSFAPANASRMAAAPRAVAERAALEMITALSAPRPGPAIAVGGGWERSPALGEAGCALVAFESPRAVNWALNVLGVVAASARPPLDLEAAPESVCAGLLSVMARGIGSGEAGGREKEESENDQNGPPTPGRKRKALVPASSEPPFWVPPKRRPFCCDAVATALAGGKKDEEKPASSQSPPWWLATSLAAADGGDGAAAWGCAAASVLRNAALTCAASASRLARPDAVAALCGVLEEAAGSAGSRGSPAANEAAADALDILICAAPSISVSAVSEANSSPAPPPSFSRTLTSKQASRLAEALLSLLGPSLQAGAESTQPLPLKLRIGAARVVAGLARGPGAAAAVLDCRPASSLSPSPSPPPPPHASPSCVSASSTSQRFAAAVAALVSSSTPAEARVSLKLAAAGACGPSEVSPKDLGTAALKAAGAGLHADAVSAGASALAALLSRRVKVVAAADGGAPSDGRTALAPGALAAAELVLRSPLLLRALAAAACGRLPEIPRTVAGGAPTGELAEAAARAAGAAADAGATCLMAAVAGRASAVVAGALGPFASALAARAVSLPAAASSGRLATNLNSLIGAVEAARLRLVASRK